MGNGDATVWRTPEELVQIGFERSRVVMMNEAHSGLARCRRTREIGQRVIPIAHACGVRAIALEALDPEATREANATRRLPDVSVGYLTQSDMRTLIQIALDLGWQLVHYEADWREWLKKKFGIIIPQVWNDEILALTQQYQAEFQSQEYTNYREEQQARNLIAFLAGQPGDTKLLVWCGNGHNGKHQLEDWLPMGCQFLKLSQINPFCIDQVITVKFHGSYTPFAQRLLDEFGSILEQHGGSAGFLTEEAPQPVRGRWEYVDAVVLSLENELTEEP
jgi:hypothetical protein